MLSIERARELLDDPTLTDKEVEEIRDGVNELVQILFEKWQEEQRQKQENTEAKQNEINE